MKGPDFFIVGAPKCGTTAMNDYLKQHPEIYVPDLKDIYFFGSDINSTSRTNTKEKYLSCFSRVNGEKRVGESSVWYLYSKLAATEIQTFCPTAKILIMLRNPIDMIYSLHNQFLYELLEDIIDFQGALDAEEDRKRGLRLPDDKYIRGRHFTKELLFYREVAKYSQQIARYLDIFGRENVHVIIFDDFKRDAAKSYKEVLQFLEVNDSFQPEFHTINANKRLRSIALRKFLLRRPRVAQWAVKLIPHRLRHDLYHKLQTFNTVKESRPPIDPELRSLLQAEFAPEVEQLSRLLDRDLTYWSRG
jgi:hypothetical protein